MTQMERVNLEQNRYVRKYITLFGIKHALRLQANLTVRKSICYSTPYHPPKNHNAAIRSKLLNDLGLHLRRSVKFKKHVQKSILGEKQLPVDFQNSQKKKILS